ncbi:MAG: twitching motility protein PilT [Deltaproteobacteria bacterium]|nr:twitching motility protein PilT [Deltaproteobacteria bacterium]
MPHIRVRLYAELNDHVSHERRQRSFVLQLEDGATLAHLLEQLGIPEAEVDLVLVDDEPAGPAQPLYEGARVALFPVFEAFDVSPMLQGAQPLRRPRFQLPSALRRLGLALRSLGFDTRCGLEGPEPGRILLVPGELPPEASHALSVRERRWWEQLAAVIHRVQLERAAGLEMCCSRCGAALPELSPCPCCQRMAPQAVRRRALRRLALSSSDRLPS